MLKLFKFVTVKIFLRKVIIFFCIMFLLFLINYIVFICARSSISTQQGFNQVSQFNNNNNVIANISPDSAEGKIDKRGAKKVYDLLNNNFSYALFVDGLNVELKNDYNMDSTIAYLNEEYYKYNEFEVSKGEKLTFDFDINKNDEIPVLIGEGFAKTYNVGSIIKIKDPALDKVVNFKVQGILKRDTYHSNFYQLGSKQYYNFSVIVPLNKKYINSATINIQEQALNDMIIINSTKENVDELKESIFNNLDLTYNFFTQEENLSYYNQYYNNSSKVMIITTVVLIIIVTLLSVWGALVSIRLMIKDFTICLFLGLSYSKLKKLFYIHYMLLFSINLLMLYILAVYSRYGSWSRMESLFATFGYGGLLIMDWLSLLITLIVDIIICVIIVETISWKIKKVPINLGVLQ